MENVLESPTWIPKGAKTFSICHFPFSLPDPAGTGVPFLTCNSMKVDHEQ
jgi:hypothetical protein